VFGLLGRRRHCRSHNRRRDRVAGVRLWLSGVRLRLRLPRLRLRLCACLLWVRAASLLWTPPLPRLSPPIDEAGSGPKRTSKKSGRRSLSYGGIRCRDRFGCAPSASLSPASSRRCVWSSASQVLLKFNTSPEIRRAEGPTTGIRLIVVAVQCLRECGAILRGEYWGAPRYLRQKASGGSVFPLYP
jgi:hypothetical protein